MKKKQGLIDDVSEKLCSEFQLVVPLKPDTHKRIKKPSESQIKEESGKALKKFCQLADEERLRHRLGVIGRARVAFGVQQRLLKAGYAAPLVKQVLLAMLASMFASNRQ